MRGKDITGARGANHTFKRRGIAIIWVVLTIIAALGISGLATDTGYVMLAGHQLQTAADNAALAAAAQVQTSTTAASNAAVSTASANTCLGSAVALTPATDVVCGNYNSSSGVFTGNTTPYNAVQVTCKRVAARSNPVNLLFGPVFHCTTADVSRSSIALAGGTFNAGVIVLSPSAAGTLNVSGTSTLNVNNGGGCQVNSNHPSAVNCHSSCTIGCQELRVNGGCSGSSGTLPPKTYTNTTACNDPCSGLTPPTKGSDGGTITHTGASGSFTCNPGYYSGGITCGGGCTVVCNPGVYICGGAGLNCSGSCNFYAPGCTFYCTKGSTSTYAPCTINTGGTCQISPPSSGTYAASGCCIFHDPTAPPATTCSISCNANTNISGLVYAPSCSVVLNGGSGTSCASQVVCNTATCQGSGSCTVNYSNTNPCTVNHVALCK
jgi:Flp pilus assembly protein TadG